MAFQFYCPQGHVLHGEESQIGQPCQCPFCGAAFLVPPPPVPGAAPMPGAPLPSPAVPGPMPSAPYPGPTRGAPVSGPFPSPMGGPPLQPFQPFPAPGPMPGIPASPRPQFEMPASAPMPGFPGGPASSPPGETPPSQTAASSTSAFELPPAKPFDLGFDPTEQEPLPFDMPGGDQSPAESPAAPSMAFELPGEAESEQRKAAASDFLSEVAGEDAEEGEFDDEFADMEEPEVYHIPCPSGHVVTVPRELLGRKAVCSLCRERFRLLEEKSLEYRGQSAPRGAGDEPKIKQVWIAWGAAALVLMLIVAIIVAFAVGGR